MDLRNQIETHIYIYTPMDTWYLTKKPKIHVGEQTATSTNGSGKTGCLHVDEYKQIHIYHSE